MLGCIHRPCGYAAHRSDRAEDEHCEAKAAERAAVVALADPMTHYLRFFSDLDLDLTRASSIGGRYEDERMRAVREIEDTRRRAEVSRLCVEDVRLLPFGFEHDASRAGSRRRVGDGDGRGEGAGRGGGWR